MEQDNNNMTDQWSLPTITRQENWSLHMEQGNNMIDHYPHEQDIIRTDHFTWNIVWTSNEKSYSSTLVNSSDYFYFHKI